MENEVFLDTAQKAIAVLETLIEGFRDGTYIELPVVIALRPNDDYTVVEGACYNRYTIMGLLFDAAIDRRS